MYKAGEKSLQARVARRARRARSRVISLKGGRRCRLARESAILDPKFLRTSPLSLFQARGASIRFRVTSEKSAVARSGRKCALPCCGYPLNIKRLAVAPDNDEEEDDDDDDRAGEEALWLCLSAKGSERQEGHGADKESRRRPPAAHTCNARTTKPLIVTRPAKILSGNFVFYCTLNRGINLSQPSYSTGSLANWSGFSGIAYWRLLILSFVMQIS